MGLKIGMVGVGAFAQCFIPLFKAHPLVSEVTLCDLDADKLDQNAKLHGIPKKSPSLDHLLTTDIDAAVIITQNWMHGPQAIAALKAGKHVYSAVPMGIDVDEMRQIVKTVEATRKIYMMGETSYYYPSVIFCRDKFAKGEFGRVVYGEGEYYHDWDHGLYDVAKWRGGEQWLETAGCPPMYYPTHSTSAVISVTGAHMTHVSCVGFTDNDEDGIYIPGVNMWNNTFSNQTALFTMSDGSCCRINEFRRIGHPGTVRMTLFGTEGSFEDNTAGAMWLTKNKKESVDTLFEFVEAAEAGAGAPAADGGMNKVTSDDGTHKPYTRVHQADRLPEAFKTLPNGHYGSHQFLVDDFVKACYYNKTPPNNAWAAARYTIPGIIAHESSLKGGATLEIPDLGDPAF